MGSSGGHFAWVGGDRTEHCQGGGESRFLWTTAPGSLQTSSPSATRLIGLADGPQRDPHGAHHRVPDEALVPHLHRQAQVQAVDLAVRTGEGDIGEWEGEKRGPERAERWPQDTQHCREPWPEEPERHGNTLVSFSGGKLRPREVASSSHYHRQAELRREGRNEDRRQRTDGHLRGSSWPDSSRGVWGWRTLGRGLLCATFPWSITDLTAVSPPGLKEWNTAGWGSAGRWAPEQTGPGTVCWRRLRREGPAWVIVNHS